MNLRARNTDPDPSHEAADMNAEERRAIGLSLLQAYARAALRGFGLNSEEAMIEAGYDITMDGHRRRVSDLVRKKLIEPQVVNGEELKRLVERTGARRGVYVITSAGIDLLVAEGLI